MAKKGFSKDLFDSFETIADTPTPTEEPIELPVETVEQQPKTTKQAPAPTEVRANRPKRAVGRPKTKDVKNTCRNVNIAVPLELMDRWDEIKQAKGSNLTAYMIRLMEHDLNENYDSTSRLLNL